MSSRGITDRPKNPISFGWRELGLILIWRFSSQKHMPWVISSHSWPRPSLTLRLLIANQARLRRPKVKSLIHQWACLLQVLHWPHLALRNVARSLLHPAPPKRLALPPADPLACGAHRLPPCLPHLLLWVLRNNPQKKPAAERLCPSGDRTRQSSMMMRRSQQ